MMLITPQNTIITFDIHGVLFKPDFKQILKLVWGHKKVITIGFYLFNPKFTAKLIKLTYKRAVPEEYFMTLTSQYPSLKQYKKLAIAISNAQKPILENISLATNLKQRGYTLHIFSNIGEQIFANLKEQYPEIFCLFDKVHVPNQQTEYLSKRNPQTFNNYLASCNPENKNVILIDDNKHNIARSAQVGMRGVFFTDAKKLHADLLNLKVL